MQHGRGPAGEQAVVLRPRHIIWLRTVLILAWLLAVALTAVVGERTSRWSDLGRDLDDGAVTTVQVEGDGVPANATGRALQTVHWRDGLIRRYAEVWVQSPDYGAAPLNGKSGGIRERDAGAYLSQFPQGTVLRAAEPTSGGEVYGWRVPLLLSLLFIVIGVLALIMLITGPTPWRATRWAWFWIWLTPVGAPAYLLLGGPLRWLSPPRNPRRVLTGGWVFLICVCLGWLW